MDSVKRALIGSSNSEYPVLFTSQKLERKWRPSFQRGKYPKLATGTEVNSCLSVYTKKTVDSVEGAR